MRPASEPDAFERLEAQRARLRARIAARPTDDWVNREQWRMVANDVEHPVRPMKAPR